MSIHTFLVSSFDIFLREFPLNLSKIFLISETSTSVNASEIKEI